eukprot:10381528-Alexandrium_andersonii.AAC.1
MVHCASTDYIMPARIREVQEYLDGYKRNAAFRIWIEQRRQEGLRAMRAAARAGAEDADVEAVAGQDDWS